MDQHKSIRNPWHLSVSVIFHMLSENLYRQADPHIVWKHEKENTKETLLYI